MWAGVDMPDTLQAAWDYVDRRFDEKSLFGPVGADYVGRLSAQICAHPLPYGLALQTALLGCCNGAQVRAFSQPSPLSLVCLAVNPPQTRKSGITGVMNQVGQVIDRFIGEGVQAEDGSNKRVKSCVLTTFTEAALFQRCSADSDRRYYSTLLSLDESYRFLRMLGLSGSSSSQGKDKDAGPTDGASQWNALLQTGHSSMACKTRQSYESRTSTCNVVGLGNMHVKPFISLAKGETGSHEVAAMERILFMIGRPVAQHTPLPESLD